MAEPHLTLTVGRAIERNEPSSVCNREAPFLRSSPARRGDGYIVGISLAAGLWGINFHRREGVKREPSIGVVQYDWTL